MNIKELYEKLGKELQRDEVLILFEKEKQLYEISGTGIFNSDKYRNPIDIQRAPLVLFASEMDDATAETDNSETVLKDANISKELDQDDTYMKRLKKSFQDAFGISISDFLPHQKLYPLDKSEEEALVFGSSVALENKPYLIQSDIDKFIDECPDGYFLIGFWGHGVNSHAFYFLRSDSHSKIFFRLPYGGVYMDNEKNAAFIVEYLRKFQGFEKEQNKTIRNLIAVNSMGDEYYRVTTNEGYIFETDFRYERGIDFMKIFDYPVIQLTQYPEITGKLQKKLKEYKKRLKQNTDKDSETFRDSQCKSAILEELLAKDEVTYKFIDKFRKEYGKVNLVAIKRAFAVIDDYCKTGGNNINGGTGLK